jgi:hypothetical protein
MMKMDDWKIGPTFVEELIAAGVSTDGYAWDFMTGEIFFMPEVSDATRAGVLAVLAAHDPKKQTVPPTPYPPGTALPVAIPRLTVIARLIEVRLLSEFCVELDASAREVQEIWYATTAFTKDDLLLTKLLRDAGADPAVILR